MPPERGGRERGGKREPRGGRSRKRNIEARDRRSTDDGEKDIEKKRKIGIIDIHKLYIYTYTTSTFDEFLPCGMASA